MDFEGSVYVWHKIGYVFEAWFSQSNIEVGNKIDQILWINNIEELRNVFLSLK